MSSPTRQRNVWNLLFDLRAIIALLFTVYGIVCIIWGAAFTPRDQLAKADGFNINLAAGIGMLVVAALFTVWTIAKPLEQQAQAHTTEESERLAAENVSPRREGGL